MLIKAGVLVSAAAATALAMSPLAFAGDYSGDHEKGHHKSHKHDKDKDSSCDQDNRAHNRGHSGGGLIDVSGNTVQVPIQACDNDILNNVLGILSRQSNR